MNISTPRDNPVNELLHYLENVDGHVTNETNNTHPAVVTTINEKVKEAVQFLKENYSAKEIPDHDLQRLKAIESKINQIQEVVGKNTTLTHLKHRIDHIIHKKVFVSEFKAQSSFGDKVRIGIAKCKHLITNKLTASIRRQVYQGWSYKVKSEKIVTQRDDLKSKRSKLEGKVEGLKEKLQTINQQIVDAPNDKIKQKLLPKKLVLENQIRLGQREVLRFWIAEEKLTNKVDKYEGLQAKAQATRQQYATLGGERVTIQTQDHVKLDGMYLSADQFRGKIKQAGGQYCSMDISRLLGDDKGYKMEGLLFDSAAFDDPNNEVMKTLHSMHAFNDAKAGTQSVGWVKVHLPDQNKILVIREKEAFQLRTQGILKGNPENDLESIYSINNEQFKQATTVKTIDPNQKGEGGTVILSSGNRGVYEMSKREALAFLMRGMNVMMVNYRGYGESEGTPTETGTYLDLEAAYQYLKKEHPVQDEKILVKGLCLSGGIVAKLAQDHPKVNAFFDQTYAEFHNLTLRTIKGVLSHVLHLRADNRADKQIFKKIAYQVIKPIMSAALRAIEPGYSVKGRLPHIKGKVLLLESRYDELTPKAEVREMQEALRKHPSKTNVIAAEIPGGHGTPWIDAHDPLDAEGQPTTDASKMVTARYTGPDIVDDFLNSANLADPLF